MLNSYKFCVQEIRLVYANSLVEFANIPKTDEARKNKTERLSEVYKVLHSRKLRFYPTDIVVTFLH